MQQQVTKIKPRLRHRSRLLQLPIYLGKMLRSFLYMSDWKLLPMSAIIAALVSMVVRRNYFLTMEGTLMGSFALPCVAIWNGCFNSIQVICRERNIVKREHRSGMHITSYVASHMVYQALLCAAQSALTIMVCGMLGVRFPDSGAITGILKLDLCITLFLISYASDMVSLLVSAIAHSTTAAMTVMPFVLIFQLVFSGGVFTLPSWATHISDYTISNYGLKCMNAQADYNNLPFVTGWTTLVKMENSEITGTVKAGDLMDIATDQNGLLSTLRGHKVDIGDLIKLAVKGTNLESTVNTAVDMIPDKEITVGEVIDTALSTQVAENYRDQDITFSFKLHDVIKALGREKVKNEIQTRTAASMYNKDYVNDTDTILGYWKTLALFALIFAMASVIVLEFIDKDKR